MSWEKHDDNCPGCRPALLDMKTGKRLPDDSPVMMVVNYVWAETTLEEREAWHRVTCQNSRASKDLAHAQTIAQKIQKALSEMENAS
jgi:hypothetical protein